MTNTDEQYRQGKQKEHQERIKHYEKTVNKYNKIIQHIQGLYDTCESFTDDPDGWLRKADIYGMVLDKVGELHYISIQNWKYADALKKESYALAIIEERPKGRTVEAHREIAVLESQEWRWKIGEWEGLTKRWENAKSTVEEQIKILKKRVSYEMSLIDSQMGGNQTR